jgi:hypothetical protein
MVLSIAGKKAGLVVCLGLLISGAFLGVGRMEKASATQGGQVGVIIPLYTYPTDGSWAAVIQAKESYPSVPMIAIINPNSGPGSSKDSNYVSGITSLEKAGVTVIGYVATGYGTSSYSKISNMESQINDYKSWYPNIQGIFFDEMSNSASEQSYYQKLEIYTTSQGLDVTVGNPGTTVDTGLLGIFNFLCIYENPGMPKPSSIDQYFSSYGSGQFSFIAYGVSSLPDKAVMQSVDSYVSYIYVTNLGGSNPYNGLPSYFTNEVAYLAGVSQSTSISSTTTTSATTSTTTTSISSSTVPITTTSMRTTTTSITTTTGTTTLSVETVLADGQDINGYYTALSKNGVQISSGYSPAAFTVQSGQVYVVTPENYGNYAFAYWSDTGSAVASRTINISSPTTLIAIYTRVSPVQVSITIKSDYIYGQSFSGMYITVLSSTGKVLAQGKTPFSFSALSGQNYSIVANNNRFLRLSHWSTGSKNPDLVFSTSDSTTLIAYYYLMPWYRLDGF